MKKFAIMLLLLTGCRSTRVVETEHWQHDTITIEHESARMVAEHDTTTRASETHIDVVEMDTAGRVRTITRIDYRDRSTNGRLKRETLVVHDTIRVVSATKSRQVPQAQPARRWHWQEIIAFIIAPVILCVIALKIHKTRQ
ncbi:MAG: hypothetical protein KBT09_03730 [Bacteroidales bacterium]|nr:hypothetical protein [Candidatus Sodaliphilus fimicaballi]